MSDTLLPTDGGLRAPPLRHRRARTALVRRSAPRGVFACALAGALAGVVLLGAAACGNGSDSTAPGGAVADVVVDPSSLTLMVGKSSRLGATAHDAAGTVVRGREVLWDSADPAVAKVDADGVVTAVSTGAVKIAATVDGKFGYADVVVAPGGPASVVVDPATATVLVGQTSNFTATVRDASGTLLSNPVTWSSDNSAVAKVSSTGVVTGISPGSATIAASSEGVRGTAAVTVQLVPVNRVVVTPATASVKHGNTKQLTATAYDASNNVLAGRTVLWTSSNAAVAKVSATGLVTGLTAGSVTITATVDGKSGTSTVTIT